MNPQIKFKDGRVVGRGIEWLTRPLPDGSWQQGYTWNVAAGCMHECKWEMSDGNIAICYAKEVALGVAGKAYPHGFEFDYWHPERLGEPFKLKTPARIFTDSMGDLFGAWMLEEHIDAVLSESARCEWHTFLSLTKNAPRLRQYVARFPKNLQVGVSSPPDWYKGRRLTQAQKEAYLRTALRVLSELRTARPDMVMWMSFEPLSFDYAALVAEFPNALRWAVIGAASHGKTIYQPDAGHVQRLLDVLDALGCPAFFKGNLRGNLAAAVWREEFPIGNFQNK